MKKIILLAFILLTTNVYAKDVVIDIPQAQDTTRYLVPLDIPDALIKAGAVELFAERLCNWTPKVTVITQDKDGNDVSSEIDNPKTAIMAAAERIRNGTKDEYISIAQEIAAQQARDQVKQQIESAFK